MWERNADENSTLFYQSGNLGFSLSHHSSLYNEHIYLISNIDFILAEREGGKARQVNNAMPGRVGWI